LLTRAECSESGDGVANDKRARESGQLSKSSDGDDQKDEENPVEEAALGDDLARLLAVRDTDLGTLVHAVNSYNKKMGYRALHVRDERESKAYYCCGCRAPGCFNITFTRDAASKRGGRKEARTWTVKSIGQHVCEPVEPFAVALANTFMPDKVKQSLVGLYEQGVGPADAYEQVVHLAGQVEMPLTWEKSDVKNFFDNLERLYGDDRIVYLLEDIRLAGHFVAVDLKELPNKKRVLNRVFVSTRQQQTLFRLFGTVSSLDATYGKNELQLPALFLTGITNEGCICSFAWGILRSETKDDYVWLMEAVHKCFKNLSRAMVIDGDVRIRNAIKDVAQRHNTAVQVFLCAWHLHKDLEKNLLQKLPSVNTFELKRDFYALRACASAPQFDKKWDEFMVAYATNDKARTYVMAQLHETRELWVAAWTGRAFTAGMMTTGISESFHALLASGKSGMQTLSDLFVRLDVIAVKQTERSLKSAAEWETAVLALQQSDVAGFAVLSVSTLLSGYAFQQLQTANAESCFFSVTAVDTVDALAVRSWRVANVRFGESETVSERAPVPSTPAYSSYAQLVRDSLSKDVDLGVRKCACCRTEDAGACERGAGFVLMQRWELLYQTVNARRRLIFALGFGEPKEAGSMNNKTAEGVLDMLRLYEAALYRHVAEGMAFEHAHVAARDEMRRHVYGGRALGTPRFMRDDTWIQCGLLDGEEVLPREHKRNFCGLWFHARCIGILRVSKDSKERTACLTCLQVIC
jgi:hypothetical protein